MKVVPANADIDKYIDPPKDVHRVLRPSQIVEQVIECSRRGTYGARLPWVKTHQLVRFAPHEISVWAGPSGSFKSSALSQIVTGFCEQRELSCVTSLEEPLPQYGRRLARQMWGTEDLTEQQIRQAHAALDEHLWFWDAGGEMTAVRAIAMMRWCAYELGIRQFVFDNVTNIIDPSNDNVSQQWKFVRDAHRLARDSGMHVHLVMHTRKTATDHRERPPLMDDIRGSGTVAQMVDQVFMLWRNVKKEDANAEGKFTEELQREADLTMLVEKAKFTAWRGRIRLWNFPRAWRFTESVSGADLSASSLLGGT